MSHHTQCCCQKGKTYAKIDNTRSAFVVPPIRDPEILGHQKVGRQARDGMAVLNQPKRIRETFALVVSSVGLSKNMAHPQRARGLLSDHFQSHRVIRLGLTICVDKLSHGSQLATKFFVRSTQTALSDPLAAVGCIPTPHGDVVADLFMFGDIGQRDISFRTANADETTWQRGCPLGIIVELKIGNRLFVFASAHRTLCGLLFLLIRIVYPCKASPAKP
mmetsp:Transcript_20030/g.49847  ORF Transcript_20030/g.49847 Transcript_20030/m.49847 type:complete len:219 (+) Transcript_20030:1081-1737(+)